MLKLFHQEQINSGSNINGSACSQQQDLATVLLRSDRFNSELSLFTAY